MNLDYIPQTSLRPSRPGYLYIIPGDPVSDLIAARFSSRSDGKKWYQGGHAIMPLEEFERWHLHGQPYVKTLDIVSRLATLYQPAPGFVSSKAARSIARSPNWKELLPILGDALDDVKSTWYLIKYCRDPEAQETVDPEMWFLKELTKDA